jgi:hypothetical protein
VICQKVGFPANSFETDCNKMFHMLRPERKLLPSY